MNISMEWLSTYYEVVDSMATALNQDDLCEGLKDYEKHGRPVLYELAYEWTDEFEKLHAGREWDGEWLETVWEFVDKKLNGE